MGPVHCNHGKVSYQKEKPTRSEQEQGSWSFEPGHSLLGFTLQVQDWPIVNSSDD